jgi:NADP-dependent 3-hydroxy acid dehydrogenase YdfG
LRALGEQPVAVITGASRGIGRATALALARRGAALSLFARSESLLAEVVSQAKHLGASDAVAFVCDLRDESQVKSAVTSTLRHFGRVDILINNAGLSLNGEVDGYSLADWRTVIDTNLTGLFLACRAVLPSMKNQGGGQILNISSGAGRNGIKGMAAYCAAKFGVIGFTEALGLEVRNLNIRVSVVLPGSTATDFSNTARRRSARTPGAESSRSIGYAMTPEEVAGAILAVLEQPAQAWMSEVVLRPLNTELQRTIDD